MALQALAARDALTGLANRRCFESGNAGLFVDVDHFRPCNDRHDHQSGDECLRAIAAIVGAQASWPIWLHAMAARNLPSPWPRPTALGPARWPRRFAKKGAMALRIAHLSARGRRACDAQSRRGEARSPQRCRRDWLLGQADQARYAAKRLGRTASSALTHAGRFRQGLPAQDRGAICTAQGPGDKAQNWRTSATFFDWSTRSADPIAWAAAGL
jgi:predicted signal transduction protein with EAL and GGDEF domain